MKDLYHLKWKLERNQIKQNTSVNASDAYNKIRTIGGNKGKIARVIMRIVKTS